MGCEPLIFFSSTTFFLSDQSIAITLPSEEDTIDIKKNIIDILVREDGMILFDNEQREIDEIKRLAEKEIAHNPNTIFSVKVHPKTKYKDYIKLLDELKKARAKKISIAN